MIFAQFTMATLTLSVGIFSPLNQNTLVVICMTAFLFVYQALIGNLFWPYVSSVIITESGFSLASLALWSGVLFMSLFTNVLMTSLGTAGTFFLFSGITYVGGIIFVFMLKETKGVPAEEMPKLYLPKKKEEESEEINDTLMDT